MDPIFYLSKKKPLSKIGSVSLISTLTQAFILKKNLKFSVIEMLGLLVRRLGDSRLHRSYLILVFLFDSIR